eukprot:6511085-Prymnesium_polylepis.1
MPDSRATPRRGEPKPRTVHGRRAAHIFLKDRCGGDDRAADGPHVPARTEHDVIGLGFDSCTAV